MARKISFLDITSYKSFIDQGFKLGLKEVGLYTTGEPFFIKNINDYISYAKTVGITYIYVTTNGALLNKKKIKSAFDSGLNSIKFSINAGSRETYKLVHGHDDFDKVIENVQLTHQFRKDNNLKFPIYASCVVTRFVEDEKLKLKEILSPYVDDLVFFNVHSQFGQSLDFLDAMSATSSSLESKNTTKSSYTPCSFLWNRVHLTAENFLTLCCVDYENVLTYADLKKQSLKEAWNNQLIIEMRKKHQNKDLGGTLCKNCLLGTDEEVYPIYNLSTEKAIKEPVSSNEEKGVKFIKQRLKDLSVKQRNRRII